MILKNVFMGSLLLLMVLVVYAIYAGIAVVQVKTPEVRLWIPVPLALGHVVGRFIDMPIGKKPELEKFLEHRKEATEILRQLQNLPDSDLVEVSKAKEHVRIFKREDSLYVHVDTPKEQVKVRVPFHTAKRLIETMSKPPVNVGDLIACLERQPSGDFVHVKTDREEVRISIW